MRVNGHQDLYFMITPSLTFMVLILLSCGAFFIGRRRAFAVAGNRAGLIAMHSRPVYYGLLTALWCAVPALIIFAAWTIFESTIITHLVVSALPEELRSLPPDRLNLVVNDIYNLVSGNVVATRIDQNMQAAAQHYRHLRTISHTALAVVALSAGMAATAILRQKISGRPSASSSGF